MNVIKNKKKTRPQKAVTRKLKPMVERLTIRFDRKCIPNTTTRMHSHFLLLSHNCYDSPIIIMVSNTVLFIMLMKLRLKRSVNVIKELIQCTHISEISAFTTMLHINITTILYSIWAKLVEAYENGEKSPNLILRAAVRDWSISKTILLVFFFFFKTATTFLTLDNHKKMTRVHILYIILILVKVAHLTIIDRTICVVQPKKKKKKINAFK